jgi:hypothetical protein
MMLQKIQMVTEYSTLKIVQDLLEQQVQQVPLVRKVRKEILEQQGRLVLKVQPELMVSTVGTVMEMV